VLGTGRSGTSAIVNSFIASGYFAGKPDELYPPSPSNPLGHHEPMSVIDTNEEILAAFDLHWWADAPPVDEQLARRDEFEPRLRTLVDSIIAAGDGDPVAIKEPRINSLLPLWAPIIEGVLHPVLALRDPIEIALSHSSRDGTSTAHALAAWEFQTSQVLAWADGHTVTIAPYAALLADRELAKKIVGDAKSHLPPTLGLRVDAALAPSVFRSDLRKEDSSHLSREEFMTPRQIKLWNYLVELPAGDNQIDAPAELREPPTAAAAIMRVESERVRIREEHGERGNELDVARTRIAELEWHLSNTQETLAWKETLLAGERESREQSERRAEGLQLELDAVRREFAEVRGELAELKGSTSWRVTAPLRAARRRSRGSA
jgi:hypothetical protein